MKKFIIAIIALAFITTSACRPRTGSSSDDDNEDTENVDKRNDSDNEQAVTLPDHVDKEVYYKAPNAKCVDGYFEGYEKHRVFLTTDNEFKRYPKYKSYLVDLYKRMNKEKVAPEKAIETYLATPVDKDNGPWTRCSNPVTADASGIGLVSCGVLIYPTLKNDRMIEFCVSDYTDFASGFGASFGSAEQYPVYLKKATSWCPSGVLSIKNIFNNFDGDKKAILDLLVNEFHRAISSGNDDCFSDAPSRVPDNIKLTRSGIDFIFQKYEIACGSAGNATINLSYHSLQQYLTPDFYNFITSCSNWAEIPDPNNLYE